jgi:hypothetical protein
MWRMKFKKKFVWHYKHWVHKKYRAKTNQLYQTAQRNYLKVRTYITLRREY